MKKKCAMKIWGAFQTDTHGTIHLRDQSVIFRIVGKVVARSFS